MHRGVTWKVGCSKAGAKFVALPTPCTEADLFPQARMATLKLEYTVYQGSDDKSANTWTPGGVRIRCAGNLAEYYE